MPCDRLQCNGNGDCVKDGRVPVPHCTCDSGYDGKNCENSTYKTLNILFFAMKPGLKPEHQYPFICRVLIMPSSSNFQIHVTFRDVKTRHVEMMEIALSKRILVQLISFVNVLKDFMESIVKYVRKIYQNSKANFD